MPKLSTFSMNPPNDTKMTAKRKQIRDAIITAKTRYITRHPFWGMVGLRLPLIEKSSVDTAGTDGRNIYYNLEWMSSLYERSVDAAPCLQFVIAHEIYHILMRTADRMGGRDPDLWNIASDFAINRDLKEEFHFSPKGILYSTDFDDAAVWYTERIYAELAKNMKTQPDGSKQTVLPGGTPLEIVPWDDGTLELFPEQTAQEKQQLQLEWKSAVLQSYQAIKSQGLSHGYLKRLIDTILAPRLPWRALLHDFVTTFARDDYSYEHLDPTYMQSKILMPSLFNVTLTGVVGVDTSGSISQKEAEEFIGEVAGIVSSFPGAQLTVIFSDDGVHNVQSISSVYELDLEAGFAEGGGGTSFVPVFDYLEEQDIQPSFLVYLTDGAGTYPTVTPAYSCLWVINNDSWSDDRIPFGRIIRMVD